MAPIVGRTSPAFSRAIIEHPDFTLLPPADDCREIMEIKNADGSWNSFPFGGEPPRGEGLDVADLFVDGSCSTHPLAERRRAAWACIWADTNGDALARLTGVVPRSLPQTQST